MSHGRHPAGGADRGDGDPDPGTCPRLADVQRHLEPLLPPGFAARTQDDLAITNRDDMTVTIIRNTSH